MGTKSILSRFSLLFSPRPESAHKQHKTMLPKAVCKSFQKREIHKRQCCSPKDMCSVKYAVTLLSFSVCILFSKKKKGTGTLFFSPNKPGGLNITCKCLASIVHNTLSIWEATETAGSWAARLLRAISTADNGEPTCPVGSSVCVSGRDKFYVVHWRGSWLWLLYKPISQAVKWPRKSRTSLFPDSWGRGFQRRSRWHPLWEWWFSRSVISGSLLPHELYAAHRAPLSVGFPREEYWSGLLFLSPSIISIWAQIDVVFTHVLQK